MKPIRGALGFLVVLVFCPIALAPVSCAQAQALPAVSPRLVSFSKDIQPIFDASCVKCHGRGRTRGGLQIDTRESMLKGGDSGPAVVVGKSGESLLVNLVAGMDPERIMPRKGSRLTLEQIGLLRAWIDQGLHWDAGITFAKPPPLNLTPRSPSIAVSAESSVNPIDQILRRYFAKTGFNPPAHVNDRLFARRVYLDTIGLLPPEDGSGEAITDEDPQLRAELVRRLLSYDQLYAEHWLSFWNDLLRNDYRGAGFIDGGREPITRWLFAVLSTNLSYDKFVAQLINPTHASEGFTKGIVWRGVVNASQSPPLQAAQNIAQVFMGVNLKCASCHDSFINDWRLSDSYGLACVYSDRPLEMFRCDKPTGQMATARFIYPELGEIDPKADKPARLKRLAALITSPKDGRLSRTIVNRLWARFFGRGLIEPVDDMEQRAWDQDLLDWLAEDLVAHHYDLKRTIQVILTSEAYQLPAVDLGETSPKDYVFRGPAVRRLTAEEFRDALGEITAVWYKKPEFPVATEEVRSSLVAADPLTLALGRPSRDQVVTTRTADATTLQALELTNGRTLAGILAAAAWHTVDSPQPASDLVELLYRRAFGRSPTSAEQELAVGVLGTPPQPQGVEDLLWAMTMQPEFQLIY